MRSFFFIALVCLMAGCKKGGRDCALPSCMNTAIEQFKTKDMICDHGASVAEYKFQGQRVFVFDTGSCIADGLIVVKDISCNDLGYLGGIMGNDRINGVSFYSHASFVATIWNN